MEATTSKTLMFLLVVACIAAAASASTSADAETQDIGGCFMSFMSVEGCIEAIRDAISHKKFDKLKPECCKAITQLGDNCWTMVYPDQPYVPILLHAICKFLGNPAKVKVKNLDVPPPPYKLV